MNQKEQTKTFMMISNRKNPLVSMVYTKIFQRLKGLGANRVYSRFYSFCLTVKLRKFEGETSSGTKS